MLPPRAISAQLEETHAAMRRLRSYCPRDWFLELAIVREQLEVRVHAWLGSSWRGL